MELGLFDAWKQKYWPTKTECSEVSGTSTVYKPITLQQAEGAFLVFAIGILGAAIALIFEKCFYYIKSKHLAHIIHIQQMVSTKIHSDKVFRI